MTDSLILKMVEEQKSINFWFPSQSFGDLIKDARSNTCDSIL